MLFAPAGYQSLKRIGELVGHEKKDIPKPYDISRMGEYLEADKQGFTEYAITDAVIACKHFEQVVQYECIENSNPYLPFTIGSLAVKSFKQLLRDKYQKDNLIEGEVKLNSPEFKAHFYTFFGKDLFVKIVLVKTLFVTHKFKDPILLGASFMKLFLLHMIILVRLRSLFVYYATICTILT